MHCLSPEKPWAQPPCKGTQSGLKLNNLCNLLWLFPSGIEWSWRCESSESQSKPKDLGFGEEPTIISTPYSHPPWSNEWQKNICAHRSFEWFLWMWVISMEHMETHFGKNELGREQRVGKKKIIHWTRLHQKQGFLRMSLQHYLYPQWIIPHL